MNILKRIALNYVMKGGDLQLTNSLGWPLTGSTWANVSVTEKTQFTIASAFSAIRLIAETIGTMPLSLYRTTAGGNEKAKDHPLWPLIRHQPNPYMTALDWKEALAVSLTTTGQAYSKIVRFESTGRVIAIYPLHKSRVRPKIKQDGSVVYFYRTPEGKEDELTRLDVLPIKGFGNAGDLEGLPPHRLHANSLGLTEAVERYGAEFFGSYGGRPSGVLSTEQTLQKDQRAEIRKGFQDYVKESWKSGALPILETGLKYISVASQNNDAQFLETRKHQTAEIARIYRVPLHMLMEMDRATYSNAEQENKRFLDYTLLPYLVRIEQALNSCLLTDKELRQGYFFKFEVNGLLRGSSGDRAQYYKDMRTAGAMTQNEIRALEDLPRIEGGDDLFVPLNMAPLGMIEDIFTGGKNGKTDRAD